MRLRRRPVAGRGRSPRLQGRSLGDCERGEPYKRKQPDVSPHPILPAQPETGRHAILLLFMGVRASEGLAFNLGAYRAFKRTRNKNKKPRPSFDE